MSCSLLAWYADSKFECDLDRPHRKFLPCGSKLPGSNATGSHPSMDFPSIISLDPAWYAASRFERDLDRPQRRSNTCGTRLLDSNATESHPAMVTRLAELKIPTGTAGMAATVRTNFISQTVTVRAKCSAIAATVRTNCSAIAVTVRANLISQIGWADGTTMKLNYSYET